MSYPRDHLTDAETVLVSSHPHLKTLILPLLAAAATLAGCGYLATLAASTPLADTAWIALAALTGIAVLWFGLAPWLRWRTTHFVITTARVMCREGILTRTGMNIPLSRITSVSTEIDLNDRVFGCGTLVIESASQDPLRFNDIPHVEHVHTLMYRAVDGDTTDLAAV